MDENKWICNWNGFWFRAFFEREKDSIAMRAADGTQTHRIKPDHIVTFCFVIVSIEQHIPPTDMRRHAAHQDLRLCSIVDVGVLCSCQTYSQYVPAAPTIYCWRLPFRPGTNAPGDIGSEQWTSLENNKIIWIGMATSSVDAETFRYWMTNKISLVCSAAILLWTQSLFCGLFFPIFESNNWIDGRLFASRRFVVQYLRRATMSMCICCCLWLCFA